MTGREQKGTAMSECQCEHESHDIGCGSTEELTTVRSSWGRYAICKQCRADHPIQNEYLLPDGEYYTGEMTPELAQAICDAADEQGVEIHPMELL